MKHACVIGAGLCGTLLTIRLAQLGYKVSLFEKRPDMRKVDLDAGRSINLALSDRGWKALRMVGMEAEMRKQVIPMHGRYIHPSKGDAWLSRYSGRKGEYINSVSRPGLNKELLDKAESYENVTIHFGMSCKSVNPDNREVVFQRSNGDEAYIEADVIFGTDGAGSAVRRGLFDRGPAIRFNYSQDWLDHGYKELTIPPAPDGGWRLEKNALHIWPRQDFMLIALPNLDGSFTVTLFLGFDGDPGFNQLDSDEKILGFFNKVFPTAVEHMPNLIKDFHDNPTSSLGTIRCYPWQLNGNVLLMGDAAHAIVPFYGQGMNCSLEDVYVLDQVHQRNDGDWKKILPEYQQVRKKDADAIADLAIANYFEMRDHVDNEAFRKKRALEVQLEDKTDYSSKYNLVTFNEDTPYSEALRRGDAQDAFLLDFVSKIDDIKEVNLSELYNQLSKL